MMQKTIKNWEEIDLIKRIKKTSGKSRGDVLLGIGDDTAVVSCKGNKQLLYTVDSVVDGIHFLGELNKWESAGKRAIGAAVSDIAAMGGIPLYAMSSLFLPVSFNEKNVHRFMHGFTSRLKEYGITLIGGNITTTNGSFAADTVVIGETENNTFITRHGARVGDIICLAGITGEAIAGLDLLLKRKEKKYPGLVNRYLEPVPMLLQARTIVKHLVPNSMIDVSDGLMQDLNHILEESNVGARLDLDKIPVSNGVKYTAELMGKDPYEYVLTGGDDYTLLFTVSVTHYKGEINRLGIKRIGTIVEDKGISMYRHGKKIKLAYESKGYIHRG
ncbi:MAG: thiamine-phosphate kinase [Deltaproteobacteria bacterium]|nr:thiamine-phosphate kinase [Deltaproteobacteria bacterium]MCL5792839.1 thiamine-phosphate kinase [Deltaproteobacteria bacterium]